jgi:diguanylate cyclase (GGDEF)-like protein/PAS domain S-box-containing protein
MTESNDISLRLRKRLTFQVWMVVGAVVISVALGGYWFVQVMNSMGTLASQESTELFELEESLASAHTALLEQVNDWKGSLLNAGDPALFDKYQADFQRHAQRVQTELGRSCDKMQALHMDASTAESLQAQHQRMLTQYASALRKIDHGKPLSFFAVNAQVRNSDQNMLDGISREYEKIDQSIAQRIAKVGNFSATSLFERHFIEIGLLTIILPLLVLLAFLKSYRTLKALARLDSRSLAIYRAIGDAVVVVDANGRIESINPPAQTLMAMDAEQACGKPLGDVFKLLDAHTGEPRQSPVVEVLRTGKPVPIVNGVLLRREDASTLAIEDSAAPVFDSHDQLFAAVMVFRDVSDRYAMLADLRREHAMWQRTFEYAAVGMAHLSPDGKWLRVNRKLCQMTGYSEAELLELSFRGVTHPEDLGNDLAMLRNLMVDRLTSYATEKRYIRKDGQIIWVSLTISMVVGEDGMPEIGISIIEDITDKKQAMLQIEHMAYHDQLTGLSNRRLLEDRMAQAISSVLRRDKQMAILYLDLDHFKLINDSLGHHVGDQLLQQVAQRLSSTLRAEDTVARMGGDEFVIMLSDITEAMDAAMMAEKIIADLSTTLLIGGDELHLNPSIGISLCPQDGRTSDELLKNADAALSDAKQQGRSIYRFFTKVLNDNALDRLKIEHLLHKALENQEFELYFQPQVDLTDGSIVGCEALIRWNHPEMGLVLPGRFIPIAEHSNLINKIGNWVIHQACNQAKQWQDRGLTLKVSFNVSARQFMRPVELLSELRSAITLSGVDPTLMGIELTESLLLDPKRMGEVLNEISALGIQLSLDDFGTGFSSLSYLRRFPINILKIDQSFVSNADSNEDDAEMVKTIIGMAHNLRMKLVAEGVETSEQGALLGVHGCEVAQGYHFSRPVPVSEFEGLITAR